MNPDLRNLLAVAHDGGTVAQAIDAAGGFTLEHAGDSGLVQVVHDHYGVVGARWAFLSATTDEQRDALTVQITDAGRARLAEVTA